MGLLILGEDLEDRQIIREGQEEKDLLPELLEKYFLMNKEDALIEGILINPYFIYRLREEFPELVEKGFIFSIIETQVKGGRYVSSNVKKNGKVLDLGAVFVSEKGIEPVGRLKPYKDLINFIRLSL